MADIIVLTVAFALVFALFYFLPTINGKGTLFGFIISDDKSASELLKKFRIGLVFIAALSVSAIVLGFYYLPNSLPIAYIFSVLAMSGWLHTNFLRSWRIRRIETFSRFAASLKPRRLTDFTNFWWEAAIVLLVIIPPAVLFYFYPQLPDSIPVHWNASGQADRWAKKSVVNVFFISYLCLYLQIIFLIVKSDIVQARFRVPAENGERILPLKVLSHLANINLIDWCRLMVAVLFAEVNLMLLSVLANPVVAAVSSIFTWLGVLLLLLGVAFYGYQITLANRQIKEITGQIVFHTASEEKGWESGIFYKNADDAAFCVEKMSGGGYTFNLGHPRAVLYLGMFVFLIVTTLTAVFFI